MKLLAPVQFPIKYRGAEIVPSAGYCGGYDWYHDDYFDASFDDGAWSIFGSGWDSTIEEAKESVDRMYNILFEEENKDLTTY